MNTFQKIIKNTLSLLISNIVVNSLNFISIVYLARVLRPENFGQINFAMAAVTFFILIADLGLPLLGTRQIAREKDKMSNYVGTIITLRLCLAIIGFILLFLMTSFLYKSYETKNLLILYGLELIPSAFLLEWVFQGMERMEYIGLTRIISSIIYLALILWLVKSSKRLFFIPCIQVIISIFIAGFLLYIYIKNFNKPVFTFNFTFWKNILKQALPIGLVIFMSRIIYYLDTIMLRFIRDDKEVGYYNAAYKIILLLIMIVTAYHDSIFPVISKYYKESVDLSKKLQIYTLKLTVTFALPLGIGGTILARKLISQIYGTTYIGATIALQILIWAGVLIFINTVYSRELFVTNREKKCFTIVTIQAVIVIILNFILIYPFGLVGAATSTVLGEICGLLMYYRVLGKIINLPSHRYILKLLFASIIMGLFFWLSFGLNVYILVIFGVSIFVVILYLTKGITIEEIRLLQRQYVM